MGETLLKRLILYTMNTEEPEGVVTMEDIIETILGLEIMDDRDVVADLQQFARDRWNERMAKYNHL